MGVSSALRQVSLEPWEPPDSSLARGLSHDSSFWRWGNTAQCKGSNPALVANGATRKEIAPCQDSGDWRSMACCRGWGGSDSA